MLTDYEISTLESADQDNNTKYIAIKRCAHKKERANIGDKIPSSWPKEAIEYLIKKEAIEKVEG